MTNKTAFPAFKTQEQKGKQPEEKQFRPPQHTAQKTSKQPFHVLPASDPYTQYWRSPAPHPSASLQKKQAQEQTPQMPAGHINEPKK